MYCKKCGTRVSEDAEFCPKCGARLNAQGAQTTTAAKRGGIGRLLKLAILAVVVIAAVKVVLPSVSSLLFGSEDDDNYYYSGSEGASSGNSFDTGSATSTGEDFLSWLMEAAQSSGGSYTGSANYSSGGQSYGSGQAAEVNPNSITIDGLRDRYTAIKGGGRDEVTIMVYMIGTDLESDNGCATLDLQEMLKATTGDKVNLIVQTGGCKDWNNNVMQDNMVERWQIKDGKLYQLGSVGKVSMVKSSTVTDFVNYCVTDYPADRYGFIFWDHGGGSIMGYGSDQNYQGSLMLSNISDAFKASGVKFDFVGYDACLMATIENAYMLEPYADYLIASEELEPGYGWDYTGWLTALGSNTSMSTVDIGKEIVDGFIAQNSTSDTLSVVELREIPYTYNMLCAFMGEAENAISGQDFRTISGARAGAKAYADGDYEMIDIVDMVRRTGLEGAQDVIDAINSCVKYKNNCSLAGSYGLSMYFPYKALSYYSQTKSDMNKFGYGGECTKFFDSFVNIMANGQRSKAGSAVQEDYAGYDWYDPDAISDSYYESDTLDIRNVIDKGEYYALQLTPDEWDLVTAIELQVLLDDGECYLDLGSDQMYEFDSDGDLKVDFDYTWVTIDGQTVAYYAEKYEETDDGWYCYGYVPATLNDTEQIEIVVYWDSRHPTGYVAGYRPYSQELAAAAKGLKYFAEGDSIQFLMDGYSYDGEYLETYSVGDPITVTRQSDLTVSYDDVGDYDTVVCFYLEDIYQNSFWTDFVYFTVE